MPPVISKEKCIGCFKCADICPTDTFGIQNKKSSYPVVRYPEECWHCNSCVFDCPVKAITLRVPVSSMIVFVDAPNRQGGPK